MMIRPTERIRCVKKQPSFQVPAQSYEEFKRIVQKQYANYDIVFTGIKARIQPFSQFRMKLTWKQI